MNKGIYAAAGSFAMRPGTRKGIHIFRYEEEKGLLEPVGSGRPEINAGQSAYDRERGVLYITHEGKDFDGERGTGGRLFSLKIDRETGCPEWIGEAHTGSSLPSYICLERTGKYVLIPHHITGDLVTKTVRNADGTFGIRAEGDDCTLALFEKNADGSVGKLCDAYVQEPEIDSSGLPALSHFHHCAQSPDGKLFLVCDKGTDCIRGFRLDMEAGKLSALGKTFVEQGAHPRYGVFHGKLPVFYQNCENSAFLHVWAYDSETGELKRIQKLPLLFDEEEARAWTKEGAADLLLTEDGKFLYASIRGLNQLSIFAVCGDGTLRLLQNIGCGGENPRGLCLSPDQRFLFCMNRDSDRITRFCRGKDGLLKADGIAAECGLPGNLIFLR